ncbi:MAG: universal stress protein [Candidatus Binataceae bacterium]
MAYPFATIVCPIAFNGKASASLSIAQKLAHEHHSTVCLLHVIPSLPARGEGQLVDVSLEEGTREEGARRRLEQLAGQHLAGSKYTIVVAACDAPASIAPAVVKAAHQIGADLIVMATHGRTGLPHELFGSVTETVVRQSRCPVLTVRMEG